MGKWTGNAQFIGQQWEGQQLPSGLCSLSMLIKMVHLCGVLEIKDCEFQVRLQQDLLDILALF